MSTKSKFGRIDWWAVATTLTIVLFVILGIVQRVTGDYAKSASSLAFAAVTMLLEQRAGR